jgi:hypothetical protein
MASSQQNAATNAAVEVVPLTLHIGAEIHGVDLKQPLTPQQVNEDIDGDPMGIVAASDKPEGELTTIDYEFPKPGADKTPVPKQTFITRVGDLVCGVGYYYFN